MKIWLRLLVLLMGLLLSGGFCARDASASETIGILKVRHVNGDGKLFLPRVQGMADSTMQAMLNAKIKEAIFAFNNTAPNSSLNGDFSVSFYNQDLLGLHFKGYSFTKGAAHPKKIDQGIHVDLATGQIYELGDLFIKGVDFESRIKDLCILNGERYRLRIEGLWDGWTHEEFLRSGKVADAAFLLSDKAVRIYTIPSYAKGAISGYRLPYEDLMDIVDQKSILWHKIQDKPTLPISVSFENVIDKTVAKVGDVYAGLTVASVEIRNGSLVDLRFTGEKELDGFSEWFDNIGDGAGYVFTVNAFYADDLPMLKGFAARNSLILTMDANSPVLPKEKIRAKIIVDNYSIGERQLPSRARLVKIVTVF